MRNLIILPLLFISIILPAQLTLQFEQGFTVSDEVNYKPIGLGLAYQAASWKGFYFSVGLAFDQVTLNTELSPWSCGIGDCALSFSSIAKLSNSAELKSHEFRLFLPLSVSRQAGRFTYGLELRPGLRIHDAIDLAYSSYDFQFDVFVENPINVATHYGERVFLNEQLPSDGYYQVVKAARFQLQLGVELGYELSERLSIGLNYRYEGFVNEEIEVSHSFELVNFVPTYQGPSRVHYFVANLQVCL